MLRCQIYVGLVPHKSARYLGQHEPIVDRAIWDAAQAKLTQGRTHWGGRREASEEYPLRGKLLDDQGRLLMPTHATKHGKRYRYYVSHPDDEDTDRLQHRVSIPWRLPAVEIENRVADIVEAELADRTRLARLASEVSMPTETLMQLFRILDGTDRLQRLKWVERIDLRADQIKVRVGLPGSVPTCIDLEVPMVIKRRGAERRVIIETTRQPVAKVDPQMLAALRLGIEYWEQLSTKDAMTAQQFARQQGIDNREVGRALPLAFLAPDIVRSIIEGRLSTDWTVTRLTRDGGLPMAWSEQRRMLGLV